MPIYEYECSECQNRFEEMQKVSDPPLTECPKCKGSLYKVVSRTSFQLKGGGWYATDYKKPQSSPKDSSAAATPASAPAETKTESKASCGSGCGHEHGKKKT